MVVQYVGGGYAQNLDSFGGKPVISAIVVPHLTLEIMMSPIDFDGEASRSAIEVQHVRPKGMLPPEAETLKTSAPQLFP